MTVSILAQGDVPDQLVAPAAVAEYPVGLGDDDVAFEVVEGLAAAPLALGDQLGVEGLSERLRDGGREPVPEQLVLADYGGVGLVPVAVPGDDGGVLVDAVRAPVSVVASVLVEHLVSPSHGVVSCSEWPMGGFPLWEAVCGRSPS